MHHHLARAPLPAETATDFQPRMADVLPPRAVSECPPVAVKPDFFIVGGPKCGTTAMADYLAAHPGIFMARKEMHFFGKDLRFASHFYRRAEREYLAEFEGWKGQRRVGEASVWYLFSETAIEEIVRFNPSARIIVMLREPVQMMYSLFQSFRYDGNEPLATFLEALDAEPDRRAGRRLGRQTYFAQGLDYHHAVRSAERLQRCFNILGRDRVHVILYEDMAANPAAVYEAALKFLEVDSTHTLPEFPRVNQAKDVKSPLMRAVFNDPALRNAVLAIRPLMPRSFFYLFHLVEKTLRYFNSTIRKSPPLEPELESQLRGEFVSEVTQLGDLIGRDLSHWSGEKAPARKKVCAVRDGVTL